MKISSLKLYIILLLNASLVNVVFCCRYLSNKHLDCSYSSQLHLPIFSKTLKMLNVSHNKIPFLKQNSLYEALKARNEHMLKTNLTPGNIQLTLRAQSQLEVIDLSWNSITYIHPDLFKPASKLKWVSLANNKYLQLPHDGLFFISNSLNILYLSHCNISKMGENMFKPGKHGLKELYLDHNAITTVHDNVFNYFEMLKILDLSYNRIISFETRIIIPLINIENLKLKNNPLICGCSTQELYVWSIDQAVTMDNVTCNISQYIIPWSEMFDNVKCEMKSIRNRRRATGDDVSDSKETEKDSQVVIIIICIVVAVLIVVFLCACFLNNSHECMESAGCLLICHHCYQ